MVVVKCHQELLPSDGLSATRGSASDVARSRDLRIAACHWEEATLPANVDLSMGFLPECPHNCPSPRASHLRGKVELIMPFKT